MGRGGQGDPSPCLGSKTPLGPLMEAIPVGDFFPVRLTLFGGGSRMKKLLYVALLAIGVIILMTPPAMAQEEKPFTLHGELRFRGEYDANAQDFDKSNSKDSFGYLPDRVPIPPQAKLTQNTTPSIRCTKGGRFGS